MNRNYKKYKLEVEEIPGKTELRCVCPECDATRSHPGDKSCCVNTEDGTWYCHHCGAKGYVPTLEEEQRKEQRKMTPMKKYRQSTLQMRPTKHKHYARPEWSEPQSYELESAVARYVLSRGLDLAVGRELRVTSCGGAKPSILFNYFEGGQFVNQKSRTLDKQFHFLKGAELIPWNIDSLLAQPLCCITEGEFDTWAMVQAGYRATTSVPNGGASRSDWLDRFIETHFDDKEKIILALDDDEVGRKMRDELVRRLGFNRCYVVEWHTGCKDANDELLQHGIEGIRQCIEAAQLVPLQHTYTALDVEEEVIDLFHNGVKPGLKVGLENFDELMSFEPGRFMVCTGRPGDGKSEFIDELVLRMVLRHGWRACYFSPENVPVTYHIRKLAERLMGRPFQPSATMTEEMARECISWMGENICYVQDTPLAMPLGSEPDAAESDRQRNLDRMSEGEVEGQEAWCNPFDIHDILRCVHRAVVRCGIRVAVLDPLNRIDYSRLPGDSEFAKLNNLIQILSQFAVHHGILLILVAHPRKVNRSEFSGQKRHVEMNDISGTADFGSKCDYCLVIDRDDEVGVVTAYVEKVKFKHLGTRGYATFHYVPESGRYLPCKVKRIPPDVMDPGAKATYQKTIDWSGYDEAWALRAAPTAPPDTRG